MLDFLDDLNNSTLHCVTMKISTKEVHLTKNSWALNMQLTEFLFLSSRSKRRANGYWLWLKIGFGFSFFAFLRRLKSPTGYYKYRLGQYLLMPWCFLLYLRTVHQRYGTAGSIVTAEQEVLLLQSGTGCRQCRHQSHPIISW